MGILLIPFCASMGKELVIIMTQDERWTIRYKEVVEFIKTNHRNPSKYDMEERNMYNYIKHTRKQMNQGLLKAERIEAFKKLLELMEENKHVNQWV